MKISKTKVYCQEKNPLVRAWRCWNGSGLGLFVEKGEGRGF
jgi:hypothetical protein